MVEGVTPAAEKQPRPGVQAVVAVVAMAGLVGGLWGLGKVLPGQSGEQGPAACSHSDEHLPARYVSGAKLCAALNRPDLPALLGTPAEQAETAQGTGNWITMADGEKIPDPEAEVRLTTYAVQLSASYDGLPVGRTARLLSADARSTTVLGHPAALYSSRTVQFTFRFDGGKSRADPGGVARCLLVARDVEEGGGSFEIVVWRQDDVVPADAALLRVARKVLPTVPGWSGG